MNYIKAIEKIRDAHLSIWGCFCRNFPDLPDFRETSQQHTQTNLWARAKGMDDALKNDQVGPAEFSRFWQEFDVVCLMLLLCAWGKFQEDIPISDKDIQNIYGALQDLCAAGWGEEGENVRDIAHKVIAEGLASRKLPFEVANLLGGGITPE